MQKLYAQLEKILSTFHQKLASFLADISADNIGKVGRLSVSADTDFFHIGRSLIAVN